jgi:hypothetical protein
MTDMFRLMTIATIVAAVPAAASEKAARVADLVGPRALAAPAGEPINAAINYTINLPLSEGALLADAVNNRAYKRSLYNKAAAECEDFLATIAKDCKITNLNVSTNENRYAGQPATLYVSVSVNMLITPK